MASQATGTARPQDREPSLPNQQARTLAAVSLAHWVSHVHILTLPPLFIVLKAELNASYFELGLAVTIFGAISGLTQAPMGFVVDQYGAKRVLLGGLCLGGLSFISLGFYQSYTSLLICAALAGLANCVYHPANYAILSATIDERRMGRAFSVHTCAGMLGGAMAPAMGLGIALNAGVGWALVALGAAGPLAAVIILLLDVPDTLGAANHGRSKPGGEHDSPIRILSPEILALTLFFVLLSLSNGGITNFGIAALQTGYGVSLEAASAALTLYLSAVACGVLAGGVLADKTRRHGLIAAACFVANAMIFGWISIANPGAAALLLALATAGLLSGLIAPSRDMMVRKAAPPGAAGRVFGVVSTGFNIGSIVGPMIFGIILDQNAPRWLFGFTAIFMLLTVLVATWSENRPVRRPINGGIRRGD
ncbi:MAG: MFS transporter [Hyphomicrobiaceae bacterium]